MKILLVDDDEAICAVGRLSLEAIGKHEVRVAASSAEGLAAAASFGPDAILLDVMLPDRSGLDTLAALRRDPALAAIPVVFLTARATATELARYTALGARGAIAKPFDPLELSAALARVLAGS